MKRRKTESTLASEGYADLFLEISYLTSIKIIKYSAFVFGRSSKND